MRQGYPDHLNLRQPETQGDADCSGFDEAVAALHLMFEAAPDGFYFFAGNVIAGAFDEAGSFGFG
jgi:hypothetical protein